MPIRRIESWHQLIGLHGVPCAPPQPACVPNLMQPAEVSVILGLAEVRQPVRVLEIGVHRGALSKSLLSISSSITQYIAVDMPSDILALEKVSGHEQRGALALDDGRFVLLLPVAGTAALCAETLPRNVDLCIVDADHRYASVKRDTALGLSSMRPGGLIVWHDYDEPHAGVFRFINERAEEHSIDAMHTLAWQIV